LGDLATPCKSASAVTGSWVAGSNRTMLLQVGKQELRLISPDKERESASLSPDQSLPPPPLSSAFFFVLFRLEDLRYVVPFNTKYSI
jgi:hypothetical protein